MSKRKRSYSGQAGAGKKSGPLMGLFRAFLLALALVAVIFVGYILLSATFETIGFGLVLWLAWVVTIVVVWRRKKHLFFTRAQRFATGQEAATSSGKQRHLLKRWNIWVAVLVFTFAIWGILALIRPSGLIVVDVDMHRVSLGGNAGKYLIGNQGRGLSPDLRLFLLVLGGICLLAPGVARKWLFKPLGRAMMYSAHAYLTFALRALAGMVRWLRRPGVVEFYRRRPLHVMLISSIAEAAGKLRGEEITKPQSEAARKSRPVKQQSPDPPSVVAQKAAASSGAETAAKNNLPAALSRSSGAWSLPSISLLDTTTEGEVTQADNSKRAKLIEDALASYGVDAKVVQINPGPSVTQFGLEPGWDRKYRRVVSKDKTGNKVERLEEVSKTRVKVERITALGNNLALALAAPSIRIEAPVPGKALVGIEVPNTTSTIVTLRSSVDSRAFQKVRAKSKLAISLGKGSSGEVMVADLTKMPHLLIAGATGSGKTVCLNTIISCLLMDNKPEDVRMLLIDPKRVELTPFNGVPHLITPVVVDSDKAIEALRRTVHEMDNRFGKFAAVGVRNIDGYNHSPLVIQPMPYLVVVIDELADFMMTAAEVVEPLICRLAQLARATGIHLVVATQRPSVDVITGLIKANFPSRISFAVVSIVDSRTILDTGGAEQLLGRGDMLYLPSDAPKPRRLQGCYVSDQEIDKLVHFWKQQAGGTAVEDAIARAFAALKVSDLAQEDSLLVAAKKLAKEHSQISTSLLQRHLRIGYPRAARLMELLEEAGVVAPGDPRRSREVIVSDEGEETEEAPSPPS